MSKYNIVRETGDRPRFLLRKSAVCLYLLPFILRIFQKQPVNVDIEAHQAHDRRCKHQQATMRLDLRNKVYLHHDHKYRNRKNIQHGPAPQRRAH